MHLQAFRLGDVLFTVCACEQWVEQSYNIKTRTDRTPGNEWLGYDPTSEFARRDPLTRANSCQKVGDGSYADDGSGTGHWTCATSGDEKLSDRLIERMRSRILNDAAGWDDPTCAELGCGAQAESEPTDLTKIRGNYTHDDTAVRGGQVQSQHYADDRGYRMVVTISMANDYNGYIASYRDFMTHDHYRKALTGWGPHSSDYLATRLVRMGHALKGDGDAAKAVAVETDPQTAATTAPAYVPGAAKEVADQNAEEAKVRAVGEAAAKGAELYAATLPDDGLGTPADVVEPKDIERFDAATFSWVGGNNYTDMPEVVVQRRVDGAWRTFADQSGEVPVMVHYPASDPTGMATYRAGGQVWRWTATFEAMVNRFDLVDPQGATYRATPAGTYRFVVHGKRRSGNADAPYEVVSDAFAVRPWSGITVEHPHLDADRHVTFEAGPRSTVQESRIRGTSTPDLGKRTFTIGPVDFPDHAADQKATGFRFLNDQRGYSTESEAKLGEAQHYCLDCRFRDWADSTGRLTATVTFHVPGGHDVTEEVTAHGGAFRTQRALGAGQTADVVIRDPWGDDSGAPTTVPQHPPGA